MIQRLAQKPRDNFQYCPAPCYIHALLPVFAGAELLHAVLAAIISGPLRRAGLSEGLARATPGQDSTPRGRADTAAAPNPAGTCALRRAELELKYIGV